MRTTTEVFEDHLAERLKGDIEADIKENYAKDVVLLTGTGTFQVTTTYAILQLSSPGIRRA